LTELTVIYTVGHDWGEPTF